MTKHWISGKVRLHQGKHYIWKPNVIINGIEAEMFYGTWLPADEVHMKEWMWDKQQWARYPQADHNNLLIYRLCYQYSKIERLINTLKECNCPMRTAIDIGGHCGTWAMHFVSRFRHTEIFEPGPLRYLLKLNVVPNKQHWFLERTFNIHSVALSDAQKQVGMVFDPTNTGSAYVDVNATRRNIYCYPLDHFNFDNVDLIKIDVEGHELPVVWGAEQTILKNTPYVLVEQKGWSVAHERDGNKDAVKFLESLGMHQIWVMNGDVLMGW